MTTTLTPALGSYSLDYVEIANGVNKPVPVQGFAYGPSAVTFIRPNDTIAYAAGDVVADSTSAPTVLEFTNIGPAGGRVLLQDSTFLCSGSSVPSTLGALRIHLYRTAPTAIADNVAYNLPVGDRD
jgi:hypothetical protein